MGDEGQGSHCGFIGSERLADDRLLDLKGGVFRDRQIVLRRVAEKLRQAPNPPRLPPVGGAILRAARRAGWVIDEVWLDRLAASLAGN